MNPFLLTDAYKIGHHKMYPEGTEYVYSNFTPRSGKHSNIKGSKGVVSFGQKMVMERIDQIFKDDFFDRSVDTVCEEIKEEYEQYLGQEYDTSHIRKLHTLGYLPIEVKILPEGTFVPYGVPLLTIVNTIPDFYWITNFLETIISNLLWLPITSATTALEYKKILTKYCLATNKDEIGFVDYQGHNFSMRGMAGLDATMAAGLGHATSFKGDDSLPTLIGAKTYYDTTGVTKGVNATEHSVMCAGTKEGELETYKYLMKQFPTGVLSIVSDTWDLWKVITEYLPKLKDEIMSRDGKVVIRPDSGDPVDIICGCDSSLQVEARKGVVELLWDIFGGTISSQGYKVLDPHIGAIYGDSITLDRAEEICSRLESKGFASTNIVLGIGSYTYQYVTRDTHGFAMKATSVVVNGERRDIFKAPITDSGDKHSARGLLYVGKRDGEYYLEDGVSEAKEATGELQVLEKYTDLWSIIANVNNLV